MIGSGPEGGGLPHDDLQPRAAKNRVAKKGFVEYQCSRIIAVLRRLVMAVARHRSSLSTALPAQTNGPFTPETNSRTN